MKISDQTMRYIAMVYKLVLFFKKKWVYKLAAIHCGYFLFTENE